MSKEKRVCSVCGYVGYYDPIAVDSDFRKIGIDSKHPRKLNILICPNCGHLRTVHKCPTDEK